MLIKNEAVALKVISCNSVSCYIWIPSAEIYRYDAVKLLSILTLYY